jgi:hypothetical protein
MTIELKLPPEVESRLLREATLAGQDVTHFVADVVCERLRGVDSKADGQRELSSADWTARLQAWADSFPTVSHPVNDSRESIY